MDVRNESPLNRTPGFFSGNPPARRINPWRKFIGSMVPNWLMRRPEVGQGAKLAYGRLVQFAGREGRCFPMQETLGRELGVGERMARNYIRELERFKLIESVQNGNATSNDYRFLEHPWMHDIPADREENFPSHRQPRSASSRKTTSAPTIEENQSEENQIKEHTHTQRCHPSGLPQSLEEALEIARELGIEEEFASEEFHAKKSVGWLDGYGNAITSWPDHLKARWSTLQRKRTEHNASQRSYAKRPPSPPHQFKSADYEQPIDNF